MSGPLASVHRFRDLVAVHVGHGDTVYLPAEVARQLARDLTACAQDIEACAFQQSRFTPRSIDP